MNRPSLLELVSAVREFLDERAIPELRGHTAYHGRVAANALRIAEREIVAGERIKATELARLQGLLKSESGDIEVLNRLLCEALRSRTLSLNSAALIDHIRSSILDRVAVDQPEYSGLATALARQASGHPGL